MIKLTTLLKEIQSPIIPYCDMDGVLSDFDEGYYQLTGIHTHHADMQGKEEFWNIFKKALVDQNIPEKEYWANLPIMPGALEIWSKLAPFNPFIITSPSKNPESRRGKEEWVLKNLSPQPRKIIFRYSGYKHEELQGKDPQEISYSLLIDDYSKNTIPWKKEGGKVILYKNSSQVLNDLDKLGL